MEFQSLIAIAPWTFIVSIANLLLQAYLFKRFLFKPVKAVIEKRQAEIDGVYAEADKARQEAQAAESEYTEKLQQAGAQAEAILTRANTNAREQSDAIVREARQEAANIRARAENDIRLERKRAVNEMKDTISGIAIDIATRVTEKEIDERKHTELIEDFIRGMGDVS